jgi:hypothetical protein
MESIYDKKQLESYLNDIKKLEGKILENLNLQKEKYKKSQDINKNMLIMSEWISAVQDFKFKLEQGIPQYNCKNPVAHFGFKGRSYDKQQEFMENFVEATHNLFKIQQNQINELKLKLNNIKGFDTHNY